MKWFTVRATSARKILTSGHERGDVEPMHSEQPPRFHPNVTARTQSDQKARQERSAAALRENLRKRKQQMRAREDAKPPVEPPPEET